MHDGAAQSDRAYRALARIIGQHDELGDYYIPASPAGLLSKCAQEVEELPAWSVLIGVRAKRHADETLVTHELIRVIGRERA